MKELSIAFVTPIQSPYGNSRLACLAENKDLSVSLLVQRAELRQRPDWGLEQVAGVKVQEIGSVILNKKINGRDLNYEISGIRSFSLSLSFHLQKLKPDVTVLCSANQMMMSLLYKIISRKKIALIVEDTIHSTRNHSGFSKRLKKFLYSLADVHIAMSDDSQKYLESIGILKTVKRSSWSVNMHEFQPLEKSTAERENDYRKNCLKVLYVGSLTKGKGVDLLLDQWMSMPDSSKRGAILVIAGTGPLENELKNKAARESVFDVDFLGHISYQQVMLLMRSSDLFVLPTLQDLFSLTVLEAMASGVPVITTPYNGAQELVENGVTGWIVDPTKDNELRNVLELALGSSVSLDIMGRQARKKVEHMDNKEVMGQFEEILEGLASKH